MRTNSYPIRNQRIALPVEEGELLSYEDVVSLATRLEEQGFDELGRKFMRFAVDHNGLSSLYRVHSRSRKERQSERDMQDLWAAMPYIVAANVLLKTGRFSKQDIEKAETLFSCREVVVSREQQILSWEAEPPLFMD
jgi:hypothetical protein